MPAATSDAWKFFDKVENETKVRCRKCNRVYKWRNSTTCMNQHIQGHHAAELQDIQNKKKNIFNLPTLDKKNLHENANRSLVFAFSSSNVPFRFAKDEWFLEFCRSLDSNYKVLSPEQIVSRLKNYSQNYKKEVMSKIQGMEKFYVTIDSWTKRHESVSIYAFFIYFIDTNMERKKIFLGTRIIDKAATAADVGQLLSEVLQSYKIDFVNLIGGITNAASNLTSFFERNSKYHLPCAAHSLALIVKAASQQKTMSSVFDKILKFAEHLSRSQQDRDLLRELSHKWNNKNALPLPFSSTRWGAAVFIAQSFKAHYECILSTGMFQDFLLTDEERERLNMFVAVASPYLVAITNAEADNTFSSEIIIQYASLYKFISAKKEQTRCHVVSTLFNETKRSFLSYLSNDMILFAIYCDARFAYYEDVLVDTTWDDIESSVINYCESIRYFSDDSDSGEPPVKRHTDDDEYDVMSDFLDSQEILQCTDSVKSQIASYKATVLSGRPSRKSSPLDFWRANGYRFPSLLMLARHSLCPPQSSAVVERLFSKCGDIVSSSKRNRLSAGTVNDMLLNSAIATLKMEKSRSSDTTFTTDDNFEGFELEFDVEKEKEENAKVEKERTEKEKLWKEKKFLKKEQLKNIEKEELIQEVQSTLGFPLSGSRNSLSKIIDRARQAKPDVTAELPTTVQHTSQEFIEEKPNNLLAESSVEDVLRHHIGEMAAFEPNEWPEPETDNFSNPGEFMSIPVGNFFESLKEMISTTIEETSRVIFEEINDDKATVKQLDRNAGPSHYHRYNHIPTSRSSYIPLEHSYGSSSLECSRTRSRLTLEEYEDKKTCLKNMVISMKSLASHSTKSHNFKREINEVIDEIEDNNQSIDVDELLRAALNAFKR